MTFGHSTSAAFATDADKYHKTTLCGFEIPKALEKAFFDRLLSVFIGKGRNNKFFNVLFFLCQILEQQVVFRYGSLRP